jgi:hypothetical protein
VKCNFNEISEFLEDSFSSIENVNFVHSSTDVFGHEEKPMEFFKLAMYVVHVMHRAELLTDSSNLDATISAIMSLEAPQRSQR